MSEDRAATRAGRGGTKSGGRQHWIPPALVGLLLLGGWQALVSLAGIKPYELPAPGAVLEAAIREWRTLATAAGHTSAAALAGFLAAAAAGFLIAVGLAASRPVKAALYPWVIFFQMIPVVVLAPIYLQWFGHGFPSVAAITFTISFFPVVATTTLGLLSADRNQLDLFALCGASRWQEVFLLRVPGALPHYLAGLKIASTLAVIGALTGEVFAGSSRAGGLGWQVLAYHSQLKTPELFATAFVACGLGFGFVAAVFALNALLLRRWHESELP